MSNIVSVELVDVAGTTFRVTTLKSGAVIKTEIRPPRPPVARYSLEDLKKDIDLIKGALNI